MASTASGQRSSVTDSLADQMQPAFTRNVRIGDGPEAVIVSPTIANTVMEFIAAGHTNACTVCHIGEIYGFMFRQATMDDLVHDNWQYTDDPAPILGVYYNGQEIPLGLLKKAIDLRKRGFSVEFCIDHFREAYDVAIPLEYLAESVHELGHITEEVRQFVAGDRIGADRVAGEEQQNGQDAFQQPRGFGFEEPPPYRSPSQPSAGNDDDDASTVRLSPSRLAGGDDDASSDIILRSSPSEHPAQVGDDASSSSSLSSVPSNFSINSPPSQPQEIPVEDEDNDDASSSSSLSSVPSNFTITSPPPATDDEMDVDSDENDDDSLPVGESGDDDH